MCWNEGRCIKGIQQKSRPMRREPHIVALGFILHVVYAALV